MRKNIAGQVISAQLVSATDGSAVTSGTTTVYVCGDGGTQASGGTATHEGQGLWSFAPSQADTNYNHVTFTFVNSSAIAATVQVYPVGYDPTQANLLVDAVKISGDSTAADNLEAATDGTGYNIGGGSVVAASVTAGVTVTTNNDKTGYSLATAPPTASAVASQVRTELTTELGRIDTTVSSRLAGASYSAPPTAGTIADAVWDEATADHVTSGTFGAGITTLLGRITSTVYTMFGDLVTMITGSGTAGAKFTTTALTNGPSGSSSVTVSPLSAVVPVRVNGTAIEAYLEDTSSIGPIAITDGSGAAVNLSAKTLVLAVDKMDGTNVDSIPDADITVSGGSSNQITFSPTSAMVANVDALIWSLYDSSDGKRVLAKGNFNVVRVARA